MKKTLYVILFISLAITLSAQVRYVRNIPIQLPGNWLFEPKYTPKEIYPTPDGGVIILGDCEAHWGDPDFPNIASDCGAIKLDADGNCEWQWWSRNFSDVLSIRPKIIGIDQEADGRVNFIINASLSYNQLGWIDQQQNYSLQQVQWNTDDGFWLYRALRLPDNSIYTIGWLQTYPYISAFFMHISAQGDTLSTRSYPPDSLWISTYYQAVARDMELDTDGMPVIVCTFSDMYGSVLKTDWDGNILWKRNTNNPCAYQNIAISKVPVTNELIIGYPVFNSISYDYFEVNKITSTGLDSLFSIGINQFMDSYFSLMCHNQGFYLAGASQYNEVSVVNYNFLAQNEWMWSGNGMDNCKGTERIFIFPDSSLIYAYTADYWGDYLHIIKLDPNGTEYEENITSEPQNCIVTYPNPMKSNLTIEIQLDSKIKPSDKNIYIYNTKGQLVRQINANYKSSNVLTSNWDGCNASGRPCASGMYFLKYQDEDIDLTKKIMVIR